MATTLPTVTVSRMEAGTGFLITCNQCRNFRTSRRDRYAADLAAADHRRRHGRPNPADHVTEEVA